MKNYVLNMVKDYGVLCEVTNAWIKKYWIGYLVIFGATWALTYMWFDRKINKL